MAKDTDKAVAEFAAIMKRFEENTDAMVIDQVNNPGGSIFYLYALASMLTDQPLKNTRHHMAITQAEVKDAQDLIVKLADVKTDEDAQKALGGKTSDGYPVTFQQAIFSRNYANFIVSEWQAGHHLTSPYWIGGVDQINPAAVHYTKPILLLTNHLDFSGGDFFPSVLQDNNRVHIMGGRTAGAGGYVDRVEFRNNIGIAAITVTESIAERANGNPIENLGCTPDMPYEMTAQDRQQNYAPYKAAILNALSGMIVP
jgi:C-terminal processing protease CtpA/Prc